MNNPSKINVAVDLTPLRPGGENGGAKTLIITLLNTFAAMSAQEFHYLLITESWNHQELLKLQGPNMTCALYSEIYSLKAQRQEEKSDSSGQGDRSLGKLSYTGFIFNKKSARQLARALVSFAEKLAKSLPGYQKDMLIKAKNAVKRNRFYEFLGFNLSEASPLDVKTQNINSPSVLQGRYNIDLLFCPFSSPHLAEEGLPLVAIAYDLQHLDMPFFFADEERLHRTQFLANLLNRASKIICISDFTRQSLLEHFAVSCDQLTVIPICIHERLTHRCPRDRVNVLEKLGVDEGKYLFFPANFWPHKNHKMLLAAYSIYCRAHPGNALHLVFTGALEAPQKELKEIARHLGYEGKVHFLGFLAEEELIALWQGCKALIFPSLYEGFGIPVLEAMWFDKPVACSAIGSLPEVGGNAVLYFDPRKPEVIAEAMKQLADDDHFVADLLDRSRQHIKDFNQESMAEQYLTVFRDALPASQPPIT